MPFMNDDVKYLFQILNAILQEIKDSRAELLRNRPNRPGSEEIYRWQDDPVMQHDLKYGKSPKWGEPQKKVGRPKGSKNAYRLRGGDI